MTIETPSAELTQQMIDATKPVVDGYKGQIDSKIFDLAY
jgi:hypothetical protein